MGFYNDLWSPVQNAQIELKVANSADPAQLLPVLLGPKDDEESQQKHLALGRQRLQELGLEESHITPSYDDVKRIPELLSKLGQMPEESYQQGVLAHPIFSKLPKHQQQLALSHALECTDEYKPEERGRINTPERATAQALLNFSGQPTNSGWIFDMYGSKDHKEDLESIRRMVSSPHYDPHWSGKTNYDDTSVVHTTAPSFKEMADATERGIDAHEYATARRAGLTGPYLQALNNTWEHGGPGREAEKIWGPNVFNGTVECNGRVNRRVGGLLPHEQVMRAHDQGHDLHEWARAVNAGLHDDEIERVRRSGHSLWHHVYARENGATEDEIMEAVHNGAHVGNYAWKRAQNMPHQTALSEAVQEGPDYV